MSMTPSAHARSQYETTTGKLTARMALHAYRTSGQDWFDWLADRLPLAGDVLEVGAGTGELWHHIDHVASGLSLTLTDFSPAMCDRLRAVPGARVQRCSATNLPFADGSFDTVVANHMLYHLDDPAVALREFARVLRPGGRLAAATNGKDHLVELDSVGAAIGRTDVMVGAMLKNFLAESGPGYLGPDFTDVKVERYPGDLAVPTVEPIIAYLESLADPPLTPSQRSDARRVVQARIDAEGSFRVRGHAVLITAVR